MTSPLRSVPLEHAHRVAGARLVPFAGYAMPVQYKSIIAECRAVREAAGMFDVSHMARLRVHGPEALGFLEWVTSNDVAKLQPGTGQYSLLPNANGGVVDDIIVYRLSEDRFKVVVNASNHEKDVAHLNTQMRDGVELLDDTAQTCMIAVQGPKAAGIVAAMGSDPRFADSPMFTAFDADVAGAPCFVARSGYTGEDGFELVCSADHAEALWNALLAAGVEPCGLGARDALRVEAGLPLYGHELDDDRSPLSAGLGWVISKTKAFLGSEVIAKVREEGTPDRLVGVRFGTKRLAQGGAVVKVDGEAVGTVSSGVFSPTLDCGIAFAFVRSSIKLNTPCTVDLRGKDEPGTLVNKRFLKAVG